MLSLKSTSRWHNEELKSSEVNTFILPMWLCLSAALRTPSGIFPTGERGRESYEGGERDTKKERIRMISGAMVVMSFPFGK